MSLDCLELNNNVNVPTDNGGHLNIRRAMVVID